MKQEKSQIEKYTDRFIYCPFTGPIPNDILQMLLNLIKLIITWCLMNDSFHH